MTSIANRLIPNRHWIEKIQCHWDDEETSIVSYKVMFKFKNGDETQVSTRKTFRRAFLDSIFHSEFTKLHNL